MARPKLGVERMIRYGVSDMWRIASFRFQAGGGR